MVPSRHAGRRDQKGYVMQINFERSYFENINKKGVKNKK